MYLSDDALDKFIAIYERNFNESISRDDANAMACRLIEMYKCFLRPLPPPIPEDAQQEQNSLSD